MPSVNSASAAPLNTGASASVGATATLTKMGTSTITRMSAAPTSRLAMHAAVTVRSAKSESGMSGCALCRSAQTNASNPMTKKNASGPASGLRPPCAAKGDVLSAVCPPVSASVSAATATVSDNAPGQSRALRAGILARSARVALASLLANIPRPMARLSGRLMKKISRQFARTTISAP